MQTNTLGAIQVRGEHLQSSALEGEARDSQVQGQPGLQSKALAQTPNPKYIVAAIW